MRAEKFKRGTDETHFSVAAQKSFIVLFHFLTAVLFPLSTCFFICSRCSLHSLSPFWPPSCCSPKKKNIFSIGWVTLACCLYKIWLFDRTVAPTVWVSLGKKTDFLNLSLNLICHPDFFRHWKKLNVKMTENDSLPLKETTPLLIFPYNQTSIFLRNPFSLNTTITDRFIVYFIYWSAASKLCICTPTAPRVSLQLCFQGLSNTSRGLIPHPGDGANLSGETGIRQHLVQSSSDCHCQGSPFILHTSQCESQRNNNVIK